VLLFFQARTIRFSGAGPTTGRIAIVGSVSEPASGAGTTQPALPPPAPNKPPPKSRASTSPNAFATSTLRPGQTSPTSCQSLTKSELGLTEVVLTAVDHQPGRWSPGLVSSWRVCQTAHRRERNLRRNRRCSGLRPQPLGRSRRSPRRRAQGPPRACSPRGERPCSFPGSGRSPASGEAAKRAPPHPPRRHGARRRE
jgi:hypothetical protein